MEKKEGCTMLKRMIKTVLNVLLFLCILIVSYLTIIRGLIPENVNAQTKSNLDLSKFGDISKISSTEIHGLLDDILKENNIPAGVIDEVLESGDSKEIINDYMNEIVSSATSGKDLPNIPTEKIEKALTKGINKYNQKYNANISLDKVKSMVTAFADKLESTLNVFYQGMSFLGYFQILFNNKLYYTCLITTLILILIMAIFYKKEFLFSLGGITIFNGIILFITSIILKLEGLKNIFQLLPIELRKVQNSFFTSGLIFILTGILLLIMYKFLCVWLDRKKPKIVHKNA